MTRPTYDSVFAQAQQLTREEQRRLRDELTALLERPPTPPAGREPLATVEATLEKIDRNPEIEGT